MAKMSIIAVFQMFETLGTMAQCPSLLYFRSFSGGISGSMPQCPSLLYFRSLSGGTSGSMARRS